MKHLSKLFWPVVAVLTLVGVTMQLPSAQSSIIRPTRIALNNACTLRTGSGTPESAVTGVVCDLFLRTDGGAGTTLYVKQSGSGNTGWAPMNTARQAIWWPGAACDQAGGYSPLWHSNGTAFPTYACQTGTNATFGELDFLDSETEYIFQTLALPSTWTDAIDATMFWHSPATSGNVVWQVQTACSAVGETTDPSWNTVQTVTDATQGTADRLNTAAITGVTTTGCAAGEMMFLRLFRDPTHASDTLANTATFTGMELIVRMAY